MRWLIGLLVILCGADVSWAAVAHQSSTLFRNPTADTSHTQSVTVSSGSDLGMIVPVQVESTVAISSMTYNGVSLTYHSSHTCGSYSNIEFWKLASPTVGTANLVVTAASGTRFTGAAIVVTGMDQTTMLGTAVYNDASSTCATTANPSTAITDGATGDLVVDILAEQQGSHTVGAGQTERFTDSCGGAIYCTEGSTEAGAASVTMSWTLAGGADRHQGAVNIKQVSAGAGAETFGFRRRLPQ